jgi:putative SOS response-associated peptidase YedK
VGTRPGSNVEHFNRAQLEGLLVPYSGKLEAYPVSSYVNSPKHDDAKCKEPAEA